MKMKIIVIVMKMVMTGERRIDGKVLVMAS
jgi:hypothetical protein